MRSRVVLLTLLTACSLSDRRDNADAGSPPPDAGVPGDAAIAGDAGPCSRPSPRLSPIADGILESGYVTRVLRLVASNSGAIALVTRDAPDDPEGTAEGYALLELDRMAGTMTLGSSDALLWTDPGFGDGELWLAEDRAPRVAVALTRRPPRSPRVPVPVMLRTASWNGSWQVQELATADLFTSPCDCRPDIAVTRDGRDAYVAVADEVGIAVGRLPLDGPTAAWELPVAVEVADGIAAPSPVTAVALADGVAVAAGGHLSGTVSRDALLVEGAVGGTAWEREPLPGLASDPAALVLAGPAGATWLRFVTSANDVSASAIQVGFPDSAVEHIPTAAGLRPIHLVAAGSGDSPRLAWIERSAEGDSILLARSLGLSPSCPDSDGVVAVLDDQPSEIAIAASDSGSLVLVLSPDGRRVTWYDVPIDR